ncbi:hypothetical protein KGF57_003562 [Candida theae]|uniref:Copper-fist domain-containing protein n=1 Tax=Candida theae TaxID=1198502 RepID=A0AAD5FXW9_9ASCO|nr:uncharacterized protein KGF57_003562 [Candida theae]KAI5956076.1 hypothetical protein KGF57_003562 [Candida theae]
MECIRGHRSSTCKHHDRPLLQVRSKGRPGVYANGNPNHRVAVFAEEIATASDSADSEVASAESTSPPPPPPPNSCKSQPIIILKASSKQVIDLTNGEIVGPYDESKTTKSMVEKPPPQQPVINDESFIISSGCCAPKVTKRSGCGCCGNKRKDVNKSKILQTYIEKKLNKEMMPPIPKQVKFISETPRPQVSSNTNNGNTRSETPVFEVVPVSSCSIPGTCCCASDCNCAGCVVHGNTPEVPQQNFLDSSHQSKLPMDTISKIDTLVFDSLATHNILPRVTPMDQLPQTPSLGEPYTGSTVPASPSMCLCPPDACDCANCEVHGIIDGHKLDEYFVDQEKLLNALVSDFDFNTLMSLGGNAGPNEHPKPVPASNAFPTSNSEEHHYGKLRYPQMQLPSSDGWSGLQSLHPSYVDSSQLVHANEKRCCSSRKSA